MLQLLEARVFTMLNDSLQHSKSGDVANDQAILGKKTHGGHQLKKSSL
jgi:hypothetical protein